MILDLQRFTREERPLWSELASLVDLIETNPEHKLTVEEAGRLHYLYERTAADLGRVSEMAGAPELVHELEGLVAKAYATIHASAGRARKFSLFRWFTHLFPRTVRKHRAALAVSVALFLAGGVFGGMSTMLDASAKRALVPEGFRHLLEDPSKRVREEEAGEGRHVSSHSASFSTMLMTHNTRVSLFVLALGVTWGIGTAIMMFYNGILLGLVFVDFIRAGEAAFVFGWLLPHGVIEIPAILLAAQAGLIVAGAVIGRGSRLPLADRFRERLPDVLVIIGGVAVMLVWAGLVEAFISQYHAPVLPYGVKIAFGIVEFIVLLTFLLLAGRSREEDARER